MKDRRACFSQGLGNDSNWNDYLRILKELKQKTRDKKDICREEVLNNVNTNYRMNIKAFWKFVNGSIKSSAKNRIETLTGDSGNSFSSHAGKVKILSVEHVVFECASYDSQRQNFFNYIKQILTPEALEAFIHSSIFGKAVFCLGKKTRYMYVGKR